MRDLDMNDDDRQRLTTQLQDYLADRVPHPDVFEVWLSGIRVIGWDQGRLLLSSGHPGVSWIRTRFGPLLDAAVAGDVVMADGWRLLSPSEAEAFCPAVRAAQLPADRRRPRRRAA